MKYDTVIAIDLAKTIFQVCLVKKGRIVFNRSMSREELMKLLITTKPSVVAFEACGSAHYWGRFAQQHQHQARMLSARSVRAFRQGHKTDKRDAEAIALAAQQASVRSCPLMNEEQQILQSLDTSRRQVSKQCRALENHLRALLYEFGLTVARGRSALIKRIPEVLEAAENGFPHALRSMLNLLYQQVRQQLDLLAQLDREKQAHLNALEPCRRLLDLEGVGPVAATMLYSHLGDGGDFKNGRQAAAYLGLTPKQYSSGGKVRLVGIDKSGGDRIMRSVLYQGAMAVISRLPEVPTTRKQQWLIDLVARVGVKRACIALANKTVRTAWALLSTGESYQPQATCS